MGRGLRAPPSRRPGTRAQAQPRPADCGSLQKSVGRAFRPGSEVSALLTSFSPKGPITPRPPLVLCPREAQRAESALQVTGRLAAPEIEGLRGGAADLPESQPATLAQGRPLGPGRTQPQPRRGRAGRGPGPVQTRMPPVHPTAARAARTARRSLRPRAAEHGARLGLGPAGRRGGGRRAEPAQDSDPAACGRCPRARAAGRLLLHEPCGLCPARPYLGRSWTRRG